MTDLNCPMCGLRVPGAAAQAAPEMDYCPRCLARTGGALSVKLEPRAAGASASLQRRVGNLLRQLRPAAVKR
jgi:Zn-finger nucleic acid-binding protein